MELTFTLDGREWRAIRKTFVHPKTGESVDEDSVVDANTGVLHATSVGQARAPESLEASARLLLQKSLVYATEEEKAEGTHRIGLNALYPELAKGAKLPNGPLPKIKLRFARGFGPWGIRLPEDDVVHRRGGWIHKAGWSIPYLFGSDKRGEYVDYYASHRMTNDTHNRIYEDGGSKLLPALDDFRSIDPDPEEDARKEAEFREKQARIVEMLKAKGFRH